MTNRCERHGTFSGSVGCPWCKAEENAPQISRPNKPRSGVTTASRGGNPENKNPAGVRVESKSEGGSLETKIELGVTTDDKLRKNT